MGLAMMGELWDQRRIFWLGSWANNGTAGASPPSVRRRDVSDRPDKPGRHDWGELAGCRMARHGAMVAEDIRMDRTQEEYIQFDPGGLGWDACWPVDSRVGGDGVDGRGWRARLVSGASVPCGQGPGHDARTGSATTSAAREPCGDRTYECRARPASAVRHAGAAPHAARGPRAVQTVADHWRPGVCGSRLDGAVGDIEGSR